MDITRNISDAICTTITMGHIKKFKEEYKSPMEIVFENENETDIHNKLAEVINSFIECGVELIYKKPTDTYNFTKKEPMIITKDKNTNFEEVASYNKEIAPILNLINNKINSLKTSGQKLYGAYIGGKYNIANNILTLLSSSQIIKIAQKHNLLEIDNSILASAFAKNIETSNLIMASLEKTRDESSILLKSSQCQIRFDLNQIQMLSSDTKLNEGEIFGSVHGLVNGIIYYNIFNSVEKDAVACEFAFSEDTTKVGSCVPCSIFASSNSTPANYTHFGRGDYWNLPQENKLNGLIGKQDQWEKYVASCFNDGFILLKDNKKINSILLPIQNQLNENIGNIFLHCLMYEGKFIDKLQNILL